MSGPDIACRHSPTSRPTPTMDIQRDGRLPEFLLLAQLATSADLSLPYITSPYPTEELQVRCIRLPSPHLHDTHCWQAERRILPIIGWASAPSAGTGILNLISQPPTQSHLILPVVSGTPIMLGRTKEIILNQSDPQPINDSQTWRQATPACLYGDAWLHRRHRQAGLQHAFIGATEDLEA